MHPPFQESLYHSHLLDGNILEVEFETLIKEAIHLEEYNKKLEQRLINLSEELENLKEASKMNQSAIWYQLQPRHALQNLAISIWRESAGGDNYSLVEYNRKFLELLGYSEMELREIDLTWRKLLNTRIDPSSFFSFNSRFIAQKIQLLSAKGTKNVIVALIPIQDQFNSQFTVIQMLEIE